MPSIYPDRTDNGTSRSAECLAAGALKTQKPNISRFVCARLCGKPTMIIKLFSQGSVASKLRACSISLHNVRERGERVNIMVVTIIEFREE